MSQPSFICRECGGKIQATTTVYLTLCPDGTMVIENVNMDQANWYCEHDHPVVGEDLKALVEHYGALDVYGRAPGVGDLNIVIFPHPKAVSEKQ